jgi:hypothetical protein
MGKRKGRQPPPRRKDGDDAKRGNLTLWVQFAIREAIDILMSWAGRGWRL